MDNIFWLAAANCIVWLGIGMYVAFLAKAQYTLTRRLQHLETISNA